MSRRHPAIALLILSAPIIATTISRVMMNFVDFVMVSRLGPDEQAAMVPARMVVLSMVGFSLGLISAVNTFVAQSLGRGRHEDCSHYAWQGVYLALFTGVVMLPTWWLVDPLFRWTGNGPTLVPLQIIYAQINVLTVTPTIAAAALSNFFTGVHRPAVGFAAAVISNLFNVVANYALIFGHFGFPALGIAGAAWATLIASLLQVAILMAWMFLPYYRLNFLTSHTWRPSLPRCWRLVKVGAPSGAQLGYDILTWTIFTVLLIGRFGRVQLAANNICFTILELSYMPAVGLGIGLTAAVGKAIGEGRPDHARRLVRWGLVFNVGYMGLLGLAMAIFRHELPLLLTNRGHVDSALVVQAAAPLLVLCAVFQVFDGMTITYNRALHGAGDTFWPAIMLMLSSTVILLGAGWVMTQLLPQWSSKGPWLAATGHIIIVGTALWIRYRFGKWDRITLFEAPSA